MSVRLDVTGDTSIALEQAWADIAACAPELSRFNAARQATYRRVAGASLPSLMRSPSLTMAYLQSEHPDQRLVALLLVLDYWEPKAIFVAQCAKIAFQASSSTLRGLALLALCRLQRHIDDSTGFLLTLMQRLGHQLGSALPFVGGIHAAALTDVDEVLRQIQHEVRRDWEDTAGSNLPVMLSGQPANEAYLKHPAPSL